MSSPIIINYPCESKKECYPVILSFSSGFYKIELWGGQGGNISHGEKGGGGGYARAVFKFDEMQTLYFFIGASGFEGTTAGALTGKTFNGGGSGTFSNSINSGASGGGGTDVRSNYSLNSRLLVAGGGSGASTNSNGVSNNGACGGGETGGDGGDAYVAGVTYPGGKGGNSFSGGIGNSNGIFGFGGDQTVINYIGSGGGGGWYGGGSGSFYGSAGGGGSSYSYPGLIESEIISGCQLIPGLFGQQLVEGNMGNGGARITSISIQHMESQCHITKFATIIYVLSMISTQA